MNIGIIVYSHTGHTYTVAARLKESLTAAGHTVDLVRLETVGSTRPGATDVVLKTRPTIDAYDALVLGSPAWGGLIASPMLAYLEQTPSLQGKKVAFLVTHLFPARWGANQTFSQFRSICESKGATVCGSGNLGWPRLGQRRKIAEAAEQLSQLF